MVKQNTRFAQLNENYLFPEIRKRAQHFLQQNPHRHLISLGIGDTTEPIPHSIKEHMVRYSSDLATREGYRGYGPENGSHELRELISKKMYAGKIKPQEIFVSDGAKCDIGRLQILFGPHVHIAIQNPTYPVYFEGSILQGVHQEAIELLPCLPENDFFPDFNKISKVDIIYFCSPNNPTGATATRKQLESLVAFARQQRAFIIFDTAYRAFIRDSTLPRSIYEIPGAKEVAIETCSFSKLSGFTGIRLGWTVVPEDLRYENGQPVIKDWNRVISTLFNGASNISQSGGIGVLQEEGLQAVEKLTDVYLGNAALLKSTLQSLEMEVYGGVHAPYLWVRFPGRNSWDMFHEFLETYGLVTTPGSGFGSCGEEFLRFSAFGSKEHIQEACQRLIHNMCHVP